MQVSQQFMSWIGASAPIHGNIKVQYLYLDFFRAKTLVLVIWILGLWGQAKFRTETAVKSFRKIKYIKYLPKWTEVENYMLKSMYLYYSSVQV